jgi:hypothetical protein
MKFHLIKRSVVQEVAQELDTTVRLRREALEHCEYWSAMHIMLTDREQRLRGELADHAGTSTLPVLTQHAVPSAPLDSVDWRLLLCAMLAVALVVFLAARWL